MNVLTGQSEVESLFHRLQDGWGMTTDARFLWVKQNRGATGNTFILTLHRDPEVSEGACATDVSSPYEGSFTSFTTNCSQYIHLV